MSETGHLICKLASRVTSQTLSSVIFFSGTVQWYPCVGLRKVFMSLSACLCFCLPATSSHCFKALLPSQYITSRLGWIYSWTHNLSIFLPQYRNIFFKCETNPFLLIFLQVVPSIPTNSHSIPTNSYILRV